MPKHALLIAPAARIDLKEIYKFGLRKWGQTRSDSYLGTLREIFWGLTEHPLIGTERAELLAGIRSLPVERHILFYRVTSNRVEIIRVLHARQDPTRHLK